jgi:hypothetical protein
MRWRLRSLPYWALVTVEFALILPIALAVPEALFGRGHSAFEGAAGVGGFIGAAIGQRRRQREYWTLGRPRRRSVMSSVATGDSTGDPGLDLIALGLLEERARNRRADQWILPLLAALAVAVPILAAVRTVWPWIFAEASTFATFGLALPCLTSEDPRVRLRRLRESRVTQ